MQRVRCGHPNGHQVELLCPQGPEGRPGLGWAGQLGTGAETYPVQADVGNLERRMMTQMSPRMSIWISIHDVLWPEEGYWHLWAYSSDLSHKARVLEKTHSNQGWLLDGRGSVCPDPGDPQGRSWQAQGQASSGFPSNSGDKAVTFPRLYI